MNRYTIHRRGAYWMIWDRQTATSVLKRPVRLREAKEILHRLGEAGQRDWTEHEARGRERARQEGRLRK